MRKALALLVAVAVGAVVAGLVIPSTAVSAGRSTLSTAELDNELRAIGASRSFQCYLDARDLIQSNGEASAPTLNGVSSNSWGTGAVVEWSNIRTTQLLIDDHVAARDPSAFSRAALVAARSSLASAITEELTVAIDDADSSGSSFSCPGQANGPQTLASLPAWFLDEQVRAQAGQLGLAALVPSPIPTSGAGLRAWYAAHSGQFDTTCISDLLVATEAKADRVSSLVDAGLPFATAVSRYGTGTTSRKAHGAIGCYSPSSPDWSSVAEYVGPIATGKATVVQGENGWYVLCPTSRTPNTLRSILKAVQSQVRALNVQSAQLLATSIQAAAHVTVAPLIGAWVPTTTGGTIVSPPSPPPAAILNASANSSSG